MESQTVSLKGIRLRFRSLQFKFHLLPDHCLTLGTSLHILNSKMRECKSLKPFCHSGDPATLTFCSSVKWIWCITFPERGQPPGLPQGMQSMKTSYKIAKKPPRQSINPLSGLVSYKEDTDDEACVNNFTYLSSSKPSFWKSNCLPDEDHYAVASAGKIKLCCNAK